MDGRLYVVATPIGNLEDLTLRALRILRECDAILAEDTRLTRKLCSRHVIETPLRAFHAHTPDSRVTELVEELRGGARLAIVTDAGTPLISDPGARLVAAAADAAVRVEPIPGASAPMAALSACGLRVGAFRFVGFLPRSGGRRRDALDEIARGADAVVLFEAPGRLPRLLADLAQHAGPSRRAAVCRELTKLHEEVVRGSLAELQERFAEAPRGEITVVVEGAPDAVPEAVPDARLREEVDARRALGEGTKAAAKAVAKAYGRPVREVYALAIERPDDPPPDGNA